MGATDIRHTAYFVPDDSDTVKNSAGGGEIVVQLETYISDDCDILSAVIPLTSPSVKSGSRPRKMTCWLGSLGS